MACAPHRESEIESLLEKFLTHNNIVVKRQIFIETGRTDLTVGNIIIEVKMVAQKNIADQLDKYSGHCEGLIVICWKATTPLKMIFELEKETSKIPVCLIEVRKSCEMI
jgi:hypothetical protein